MSTKHSCDIFTAALLGFPQVNHKVTVEDLKEEIFTVLEPWPKLIEAMEEQPVRPRARFGQSALLNAFPFHSAY